MATRQPHERDDGISRVTDLPEGWALTRLGQVCELNPPKPSPHFLAPYAMVTFVPMAGVDARSGTIAAPEVRPFSSVRRGYTSFRDGDVIMAKITPCAENGKAAVASNLRNTLGFGSTEFHVLRPSQAALAEYVYHFIRQQSFREAAAAEMTGSVGQKRVPAWFLETAVLPLPPVTEQKRIVAKIESLIARIDAVRENLARVPASLKRFRQSVLAAACSGSLTADWRESRIPTSSAEELLKAIVLTRRDAKDNGGICRSRSLEPDWCQVSDVPEEWAITSLDQISCLITSGSRGWAKYYSDSGPLFIRAQDINTDRLRVDGIAHVRPPQKTEGSRTRVQVADLLVTITGANVTKAAVVDFNIGEAYVSQHVALVRPVSALVAPFVHLWIISPSHGRKKLLGDAYGAGKPGLNLDNLREVVFALPPLAEQQEIVRRVERLFKLADVIDKRIAIATARAEQLTQSILAKAFRGKLVPTEAELARRDGRPYEPASALLSRISAESQHQSTSNQPTRRGLNNPQTLPSLP